MKKFIYYPLCPISNLVTILSNIYNIELDKQIIVTKTDLKFLPILNNSIGYIGILNELRDFPLVSELFTNKNIMNFYYYIEKYLYYGIYYQTIYEKTLKLIIQDIIPTYKIAKENINKILYECDAIFINNNYVHLVFTISDLILFSLLAVLDYGHQINWVLFNNLKRWYIRLKSNKLYNIIFEYRVTMIPPLHYNLQDIE